MSTKIVKLDVAPTKKVLNKFASSLNRARKGEKIDHHGVSFESIESLRNVLTKRRLELLSVIKRSKPNSVYELSKTLNRDLKSVNTDLKVLKENDFVHFRRITNGRQRLIPVVEFDKIEILVSV